ncbi:MAG: 4'-phosphopantetheinyl transferase superfamily protein [Deltaproteobacteria bacterium]|nr:4'-phosphopantetheinyl transferase superfamily protein [Deltaproteobacteria bacterium]
MRAALPLELWVAGPEALADDARLRRCLGLLDEAERARYARFLVEGPRRTFALAHGMLREVLSRHAAVEPGAWRWRENAYGRPEVALPLTPETLGLRFNLSHTEGMVAVLVTRGRDAGVDTEHLHRRVHDDGIAERFFAPDEVRALRTVPEAQRRRRFFDYWTLKEAYIKARGMGLAIPLHAFAYGLPPWVGALQPEHIQLATDPSLNDDPSRWRFAQWAPEEAYLVSAAVRCEDGDEPRWTLHRWG